MWLDGSLDDESYIESLKNIVDPEMQETQYSENPYLQLENGFVIAEVAKNVEIDWQEHLNPGDVDQRIQALVSFFPTEYVDEVDMDEVLPHWFKSRALMWTDEKIADKVFLDGIEHLVRSGSIQLS